MSLSKCFEFAAVVRGFHVYQNLWAPQLNEKLEGHLFDSFGIKIFCRTDNEIVGNLLQVKFHDQQSAR